MCFGTIGEWCSGNYIHKDGHGVGLSLLSIPILVAFPVCVILVCKMFQQPIKSFFSSSTIGLALTAAILYGLSVIGYFLICCTFDDVLGYIIFFTYIISLLASVFLIISYGLTPASKCIEYTKLLMNMSQSSNSSEFPSKYNKIFNYVQDTKCNYTGYCLSELRQHSDSKCYTTMRNTLILGSLVITITSSFFIVNIGIEDSNCL